MNMQNAGQVIKNKRLEKGLSQEVISGFADLNRSHYSAIENGKKIIRLDTFLKLAAALDVNPPELLDSMIKYDEEHS